jgi:HK97 family phage prohead protease
VANVKTNLEFAEKNSDFKRLGINRRFNLNAKDIRIKKEKSEDFSFEIEGYASTTDKDRDEDIITHEALLRCKDDLLKKGSSTVLYNHDYEMPIGRVLRTRVDSKGLIVRVGISNANDVKSIRVKIREGVLRSFSIGGRFKRVQVERDEEGKIISFKVLEMELFEVSVVSVPANPEADIFEVVEKMYNSNKEKAMSKTEKEKVEPVVTEKSIEKKEDAPVIAPSITKEEVSKMIGEATSPILEAIKVLTEKTVAPPTGPTGKAEEKPVEKVAEIPQWAKDLNDKIDKLSLVPSRKGIVTEETEETEVEETEEKIEKALVSADDEKSVAFVKHVMDNTAVYSTLTKEEKAQAAAIYFVLLQKKVTKKES